MNYYPFHIGDYLSATRHLSWEEDAAFRRLLDTYYTTEKPLPADHRAVCRLVMATTETQREAVRVVLEEFFELIPEGWVNRRADSEIAGMREKQQKQRDKANKRWSKPRPERGNAPAMPRQEDQAAAAPKDNANAMPPTPTPTPRDIPATPGAEAPPAADPIWGTGLDFLLRKGLPSGSARSFLGLLRKELHDDLTLAELLLEAERQDICNPQAWLTQAAKQRKLQNGATNATHINGRKLSAVEQVEHAIRERREREAGTAAAG